MNKSIQSELDIWENEHFSNFFTHASIWEQLSHFSWIIQIIISNALVTIN